MAPDPVADFLAECGTLCVLLSLSANPADWKTADRIKKLVAMVRALRKQVMLDMQPNEELQRILKDVPHETQTPDS